MKKLYLLPALLAAALLTTSCSSDNDTAITNGTDILSRFNIDGEAFLRVQVTTPSNSGTRANDQFENATPAESKAASALLVLFAKTTATMTENQYVFQGAYQLSSPSGNDADANDVQKIYTTTIKKDGLPEGSELYAFVALNYQGIFVPEASNALKVNTNGGVIEFKPGENKTFGDFQQLELEGWGNLDNGLLMTNAPLSTQQNTYSPTLSGVTYTTLAKVDADKVHPNKAAAEALDAVPSVEAYVERVMAKLTVNCDAEIKMDENTTITIKPENIKWAVDNTETSWYVTRHVSTTYLPYYSVNCATTNRFLGAAAEYNPGNTNTNDPTTTQLYYRIYWAESPHYSTGSKGTDTPFTASTFLNRTTTESQITNAVGTDVSAYVPENTMDANHMTFDHTTRVLIAIQLQDNGFFTVNNSSTILTKNQTQDAIKDYLLATFPVLNGGDITKVEINETSLVAGNVPGSNLTITWADGLTGSKLAAKNDDSAKPENIVTILGLKYFANGTAYYQARIKHFGDDETPLAATADATYVGLYGAEGTQRDQNFLGRYGVVRNNHYILNINSVRRMGDPTVPVIPTDEPKPDDEVEYYISTRIYVTKWAVRNQNTHL